MTATKGRLLTTTVCAAAAILVSGCNSTGKAGGSSTKPAAETRTRSQAAVGAVATAEQAIRDGDLDRALAEFQRAIQNNPTLTPAHMGMGDIYRMRGDYARAEEKYARSAQIEPRNFDAQYYHGLMLHVLDRLTEAVQAYLRALSVKPNDFKANLNVATAYYQLDENTQALPYARRAVELDPEDGPSRFNLGAVYAALNRHGEAVREYQQAAELMPLNPPLLLNLGESLGRLERYEEMSNVLVQSLKLEQSPAAWERLGLAKFRMGKFDEARTSFESSLKLDPGYFPALNGFGVCRLNDWIRTDRTDQRAREAGLSALRRSLQANRDQPAILEIVSRYGR